MHEIMHGLTIANLAAISLEYLWLMCHSGSSNLDLKNCILDAKFSTPIQTEVYCHHAAMRINVRDKNLFFSDS